MWSMGSTSKVKIFPFLISTNLHYLSDLCFGYFRNKFIKINIVLKNQLTSIEGSLYIIPKKLHFILYKLVNIEIIKISVRIKNVNIIFPKKFFIFSNSSFTYFSNSFYGFLNKISCIFLKIVSKY